MGCHRCLLYTRMLVYFGTLVLHAYNIVALLNSFQGEPMKIEEVKNFKQMQMYFFTCWTFVFQMLYASFAIFCDWMALVNNSEKTSVLIGNATKFRNFLFGALVWPSSLLVSTYFWGFYAYDRNLFYPEYIDAVITPLSNHIMHTLIIPIVVFELVLNPKRKPESHILNFCCLTGLEVVYISSLLYAHRTTGIWVYPIFGKLYGTLCLPMFLAFTLIYSMVLYYGQFCISFVVIKYWQKIGEKYCRKCVN